MSDQPKGTVDRSATPLAGVIKAPTAASTEGQG
jgi:hypothetical protein